MRRAVVIGSIGLALALGCRGRTHPGRRGAGAPGPSAPRISPRPAHPPASPRGTPSTTPPGARHFAIDLAARPLGLVRGGPAPDQLPGWQPLRYRGTAGDWVAGFAHLGRPAATKRPAVLLAHGHGGSKHGMARYFGAAFTARGAAVIAVDHPFHGERARAGEDICPGDPGRLIARWRRAVRDLRRAVAVTAALPGIDAARIGLVGFSLGGVLGGLLAAHEPRVRAAALVSAGGDWSVLARSNSRWKIGWDRNLLPRWLRREGLRARLASVDPARHLRRFSPRPLLVVAGRRDRVIHPDAARALHRAAGPSAVLRLHPGGHGVGPRLRAEIAKWLLDKLR